MRQYIVSWTVTLNADTPEAAVVLAALELNEGNISPEVEELTGDEKIDLSPLS